jgi:hypothetical protein
MFSYTLAKRSPLYPGERLRQQGVKAWLSAKLAVNGVCR